VSHNIRHISIDISIYISSYEGIYDVYIYPNIKDLYEILAE